MFSKLGRFEIKDVLGRGAMGEVYLGVDPVLGREVAIKTIISSALPEDQARQRFDREAKAAAVLNSPNIVTIHELGEDQGVLFIAMERLKGQDLEQILLQRSLNLVESLEVLAQVCDGLDVAHRNHIIHRDIKPSNIMVMREGRKLLAKLMDFGVARLKDSAMTMKGTVVGTVNYIAPEYIRSGEPDARSDLFAVGVMLYECIAGRKPFDGGSASTVLFKIVNDPPDPLDLPMLQGLSPALRNMTEKALAKSPDERFQTAEEFALALRAAKDPAWNGKVDETTIRMRIRPLEPPPVIEPIVELPVVHATPAVPEPSPGTAKDITQELVVPPDLVQKIPVPPVSAPSGAESYKTISIPLPSISKAAPPAPEVLRPDTARTQVLNLQPLLASIQKSLPAPTDTQPVALPIEPSVTPPPAPRTEILQVPPPAASAGTAELVVTPPPAPGTEILQVLPPAASAGTAEFVVPPPPPSAPGTVILKVQPPPVSARTAEFVVTPPPAPGTEILQVQPPAASAGTAEIVVTPPPAPGTEILQVQPPAASAGTAEIVVTPPPAPGTVILQAAASAGTAELAVTPPPAPRTVILRIEPASPAQSVQEGVAELKPVMRGPQVGTGIPPAPTKRSEPAEPERAENLTAPHDSRVVAENRKDPAAVGAEKPVGSSHGLVFAILGIVGLALAGGVGYFFFKARAAQPASIEPAPSVPVEPPPPPPAPVVQTPEAAAPEIPAPAVPSAPVAKPATPTKVPKKAAPAPKTPPPAQTTVAAEPPPPPPPPVEAAAPPPSPPQPAVDPKKKWAEDAAKKRKEMEDKSRK